MNIKLLLFPNFTGFVHVKVTSYIECCLISLPFRTVCGMCRFAAQETFPIIINVKQTVVLINFFHDYLTNN